MSHLPLLFLALIADRLIGDPPWLWGKVKHPVVLFGAAISFLDVRFNRDELPAEQRRLNGLVSATVLVIGSGLAGLVLHALLSHLHVLGVLIEILIVAVLLAQKSLADHVAAVADGLRQDGLEGGRRAVSLIVGRDPKTLDEPGVCRAAIESLAENFADGVVAPAFWYAVGGLPGIFAYKMLNTADSMIGHKSPKYLAFGWAAARLDDLANWPAARLSLFIIATGALFTAGRAAMSRAFSVGRRDAGLHRSPNSGWPEAAFAGALDLRLAGPRVYGGDLVSEPMINGAGRADASAVDIDRATRLFWASCSVTAGLVLAIFAVTAL
ncbi:cobalamin biosynthesis protein [Ciceribacter sp. L1K23]|uniref:adenosylcobinamide-phosphate synthase CbiB n=1 Tax=Ciceribacter sp. L1K23 TaxID=2820276 RepID=UPI001B820458|nr:adenosylcobinamide-phosphate synthase CbiB [Ciceribacter sp. L1K23]MBR0555405.1 cobalamin biosynthesis protein [Ciceribacter sp. L1K23]